MPIVNYISLTDEARGKIKSMMEQKTGYLGIRVGIKQKGCSGMVYSIEYAKENLNISKYDDIFILDDETKIFIDPKISMFIIGLKMDYVVSDTKSGFVFVNPNEKGKCGCGESFYVS
jgi:iron-sulfur cluster assembly protein